MFFKLVKEELEMVEKTKKQKKGGCIFGVSIWKDANASKQDLGLCRPYRHIQQFSRPLTQISYFSEREMMPVKNTDGNFGFVSRIVCVSNFQILWGILLGSDYSFFVLSSFVSLCGCYF